MAPPPEYDKEPKAPDKSAPSAISEDHKLPHNLASDQHTSSDCRTAEASADAEPEDKDVETLDDGQLRALLDEAITYKCPKDREGKSSLFKELLEEVEQDEQACEAAARSWGGGGGSRRGARGARGGRRALAQSNSLQDLVAALAAEPTLRRRHPAPHAAAPVSARTHHGGSLPSGVDTSFLLGEEPSRSMVTSRGGGGGGAGYVATVHCVNPSPLSERRVSASDAAPHTPQDKEHGNRRSKTAAFPVTYTARASLEIGSGSVGSGRAVTTTTASNQVRTRYPQQRRSSYHALTHRRPPTVGPPERMFKLYVPVRRNARRRPFRPVSGGGKDDEGEPRGPGAVIQDGIPENAEQREDGTPVDTAKPCVLQKLERVATDDLSVKKPTESFTVAPSEVLLRGLKPYDSKTVNDTYAIKANLETADRGRDDDLEIFQCKNRHKRVKSKKKEGAVVKAKSIVNVDENPEMQPSENSSSLQSQNDKKNNPNRFDFCSLYDSGQLAASVRSQALESQNVCGGVTDSSNLGFKSNKIVSNRCKKNLKSDKKCQNTRYNYNEQTYDSALKSTMSNIYTESKNNIPIRHNRTYINSCFSLQSNILSKFDKVRFRTKEQQITKLLIDQEPSYAKLDTCRNINDDIRKSASKISTHQTKIARGIFREKKLFDTNPTNVKQMTIGTLLPLSPTSSDSEDNVSTMHFTDKQNAKLDTSVKHDSIGNAANVAIDNKAAITRITSDNDKDNKNTESHNDDVLFKLETHYDKQKARPVTSEHNIQNGKVKKDLKQTKVQSHLGKQFNVDFDKIILNTTQEAKIYDVVNDKSELDSEIQIGIEKLSELLSSQINFVDVVEKSNITPELKLEATKSENNDDSCILNPFKWMPDNFNEDDSSSVEMSTISYVAQRYKLKDSTDDIYLIDFTPRKNNAVISSDAQYYLNQLQFLEGLKILDEDLKQKVEADVNKYTTESKKIIDEVDKCDVKGKETNFIQNVCSIADATDSGNQVVPVDNAIEIFDRTRRKDLIRIDQLNEPGSNENVYGSPYVLAEISDNSIVFLTLPKHLLDPSQDVIENSPKKCEITYDNSPASSRRSKKKNAKVSRTKNDRESINHKIMKALLFENLSRDDNRDTIVVEVASSSANKVDSGIPFSCITTPEVVTSCNTTSSTSQATVVVDPKPLQLGSSYRAVASVTGGGGGGGGVGGVGPWERASPEPAETAQLLTTRSLQPRSVIAGSFNGLPLSRTSYGSTSNAAPSEEYKKSLDENGNSVQGYSSPLSGSSQDKKKTQKKKTKKSSRNETVIDINQIVGYQGNKDLNELLRFIESAAEGRPKMPRAPAKHHEDGDDKGKKRSTERRKDKESRVKRASSLDAPARTAIEDLTDKPELRRAKQACAAPAAAPAARRSWGDDARDAYYYRDEPAPTPAPAPAHKHDKKKVKSSKSMDVPTAHDSHAEATIELMDFQTVTKKKKQRKRADDAERGAGAELGAFRKQRAASPEPRRKSAPPSDKSNDSNDDMDSVHSLPADAPSAPPAPRTAPAVVSYADIARTRHNIPDLIESCNYYVEAELPPEPPPPPPPPPRQSPPAPPRDPPLSYDADSYPALEVRTPRSRPRDAKPSPPVGAPRRKEPPRGALAVTAVSESSAAEEEAGPQHSPPDLVAGGRPPVILLDEAARPRDLDGVTFGFDINEQLLNGAGARRCDLVHDALAGAGAAGEGGARCSLRYVPPPLPPAAALHLDQIVDYVGSAWDDIIKCGGGKVRYFSD